jgi:uncharacterized repeat protein (TIGR01451 family)
VISIVGDITPTITGFRLTGGNANAAGLDGNGGGVSIDTGRPITLSANMIYSNSATNGGAIYARTGSPLLQNNIVYTNSANLGGGVYMAVTTTLVNNTLVANHAVTGGALYLAGGALAVTNTILAGNTADLTGGAVYSAGMSTVSATDYNDLWNNTPNIGNVPTGTHSITADPLFQNAAAGDFHLTAYSMAIDRGLTATLATDFESDTRPQLTGYDIGADEFRPIRAWQFAPGVSPAKHTTVPTVTYDHVLTNTGNYTDTALITFTIDRSDWQVVVSLPPSLTLGPGLATAARVTVTIPATTTIGAIGTAIVTATSQADATQFGRTIDATWFQNDIDVAIGASITPIGWLGPGGAFTYTLIYTNAGPANAADVVITDRLPITMTGNVSFASSGPAITARPGSPYVWDVQSFAPGTIGMITVTGIVSPTPGVVALVTNTARIATTQNDLTLTNNLASVLSRVDSQPPIVLGQALIEPAHNTVTFPRATTFSWDANGFSDQSGSGILGYDLIITDGSGISRTYTTYSPTTSFALTLSEDVYTWTVRAFDTVGNRGALAAPFSLIVEVPNLSVGKYAAPATPVAGTPFAYYLTITNTARIAATGMVLTDALPAGASFISAAPSGSQSGGSVTWSNLSASPLGGTTQATLVVSACQTVSNTAYRVASSNEGAGSPMGSPAVATTFAPATISPAFISSAPAVAGQAVIFTDTSTTNGVLAGSTWDFGDGQSGSGPVIGHAYSIAGTYTVRLTVRDVCGVTSFTTGSVAVTGTPKIAVTPASLSASLMQGSTTTRTLTINNTGTADLTWNLSEVSPVPWLDESPIGGNVGPLGSASVVVTFTAPNTSGALGATLRITSNDPGGSPLDVPATLSVEVPVIAVAPASLAATLNPGGATARTLTVNNTGVAPLIWNLIEAPAATWLDEAPTSGAVAPGGSASVVVTFTAPAATGVYSTTLIITSNDPVNPQWNAPTTLQVDRFYIYLPLIRK